MKKLICFGGSSTLVLSLISDLVSHFEEIILVFYTNDSGINNVIDKNKKYNITALSSKDFFENTDATQKIISGVDSIIFAQSSSINLAPILKKTNDDFLKIFENQILYTHNALRVLLPSMSKNKRGLIISILSSSLLEGSTPGLMSDYITAKGALKCYMDALKSEYGKKNIKFESLFPRFFPSSLNSNWPKVGPYGDNGDESITKIREEICELISNYKESL